MPIATSVAMAIFPDTSSVLLLGVGRQLIGFALSLGLWQLYRRWPARGFKLHPHLLSVVTICLLASGVDALLTETAARLFGLPAFPLMARVGALLFRFGVYLVWSAFYFVIRQEYSAHATALRLAREETLRKEAELHALRAQVNPHFLFNALGTIIGLAEHNPAAVAETTHAVADYLRYSLHHGTHFAPLGDELDAMANYLRVEHLQHAGRIHWTITADDATRATPTPTAVVQPLVENAIKYGLTTSGQPLHLAIHARIEAREVRIAVTNSGTWRERLPGQSDPKSTGIGLNNLRRRLTLLCGESARLEVSTPPGHVCVEIRLPQPTTPDSMSTS